MSAVSDKAEINDNYKSTLDTSSDKENKPEEPAKAKSPPNLSDMPNHVAELIIGKSEYKEQLILRKVSKSMRSLVDKSKPSCESVYIECSANYIRCHYNDETVVYAANGNLKSIYDYNPQTALKVFRDDYESVAFEDLKGTLSNPKLQLDALYYKNSNDNKMETILKSLNHQLWVKEVNIGHSNVSSILTILSYLKPEVLETICLGTRIDDSDTTLMHKLSSLEQWKQAQELQLVNGIPIDLMEYATHFKRFVIFFMFSITKAQLITLRNHFSGHGNFEFCVIHVGVFDSHSLVMAVGLPAPPNEMTDCVSHYSIPDSNDYLEFQFFYDKIIIKKKNRLSSQS